MSTPAARGINSWSRGSLPAGDLNSLHLHQLLLPRLQWPAQWLPDLRKLMPPCDLINLSDILWWYLVEFVAVRVGRPCLSPGLLRWIQIIIRLFPLLILPCKVIFGESWNGIIKNMKHLLMNLSWLSKKCAAWVDLALISTYCPLLEHLPLYLPEQRIWIIPIQKWEHLDLIFLSHCHQGSSLSDTINHFLQFFF